MASDQPAGSHTTAEAPMAGFKKDDDKLRWDLLSGPALQEMCKVATFGARKYPARNWEKGIMYGRIFAALMRHAWAWWMGEKNDPETGYNHMAHAMWCCMALCHYDLIDLSPFDDRPPIK